MQQYGIHNLVKHVLYTCANNNYYHTLQHATDILFMATRSLHHCYLSFVMLLSFLQTIFRLFIVIYIFHIVVYCDMCKTDDNRK